LNAHDELAATVQIAEEAGQLVLQYFASDEVDVQAKGVRDVVTAADLASEQLIKRRLRQVFPDDGMVGEEGTDVPGTSGRLWYVDPLDGTLNYSRGIPIWCVSLALYRRDEPLVGVIHDPVRRETFSAAAGLGAWCNGHRIETSGVEAWDQAVVHITVDFTEGSLRAGLEDIQVVAPAVLRTRNIGSAALSLAYVAAGRLDAVLHRHAHAWDYGAGVILVQEAGGRVTGLDGAPHTPACETMLAASTEALHGGLLGVILPLSER
jgi:myo-inositol-1(or 4)-monophosphatase